MTIQETSRAKRADPALVRAAVKAATGTEKGNVSKFARLVRSGANTIFRWRKGSLMDGATRTLLAWIVFDPEGFQRFSESRPQETGE
jgi:hypothetical protein